MRNGSPFDVRIAFRAISPARTRIIQTSFENYESGVREHVKLPNGPVLSLENLSWLDDYRAFTSMAVLQNVLGKKAKCMRYLDFAMSIIVELSQEAVPAEGWYKLRQKYAELDQECSTFPASIEKRNIFRKSELCRWVTKLEVRLGHSFHKDLFGGGFHEEAEWDPTTNRATDLSNECSGVRAAEEVARGGRTGTHVVLDINPHEIEGGEEEVLPPPGEMSHKFAENVMREFDVLEHVAVTNADIRGGLGELCFRGIMSYASHVEGHVDHSLQNLMRCGEIIAEHPGLCRYTPWRHTMHCILSTLATLGIQDKYQEMREVYNSMNIQPGTPKAPPLEEWSSMKNICDGYLCRSTASIDTSKAHGWSSKDNLLSHSSFENVDVSSSEAVGNGSVQYDKEGKHWAMTVDDHDWSTLEGKDKPDESKGFVEGCVAATRNGQGIPREK